MKNFNVNFKNKNLWVGLLIGLVLCYLFGNKSSYYQLRPFPIVTQNSNKAGNIKSFFDLPYDLQCVPGPSEKAAYYTTGLNPGGLCGSQDWVGAQATYQIDSGIGGSLLSPDMLAIVDQDIINQPDGSNQ